MRVHVSVLAYCFQRDLMITLCGVVKDCKNFKVRINAALALGSPAERSHYGDCRLFAFVWESLVIALETSEDITDFAEFKYRNNLNNQVHNWTFYQWIIIVNLKSRVLYLNSLESLNCWKSLSLFLAPFLIYRKIMIYGCIIVVVLIIREMLDFL